VAAGEGAQEAVMTIGDSCRLFAAGVVVVAVVVAANAGARAEFMEGNDLYDACTGPDSKLVCLNYVMAIADAAQAPAAVKRSPMCPGSEVVAEQVVDVVTRYLAAHPEKRHLSAPLLVANALAEAYPCP
jgi:hypothetical protein